MEPFAILSQAILIIILLLLVYGTIYSLISSHAYNPADTELWNHFQSYVKPYL